MRDSAAPGPAPAAPASGQAPAAASAPPDAPREAGLEEVLAAREARVLRVADLAARFGLPVVALTLVSPGGRKDSVAHRALRDRALARLGVLLAAARLEVCFAQRVDGIAGPEALLAVGPRPGVAAPGPSQGRPAAGAAGAPESLPALGRLVKEACLALEEEAWGRLVDADVHLPGAGVLRREELGRGPRPCLVCGAAPALECIAARRHPRAAAELAARHILARHFRAGDGGETSA